jgi:fibronectin type 3 domain-containing protein
MSRKTRCIIWLLTMFTGAFITGCTRCDGNKAPDKTPPTVPNGISITAVSPSEVKVAWKPSADDRGLKGYKIYRNGEYLKTTTETAMTDTGLTPKTKYCYKMSAIDAAENESAQSTDVCAIL